MSTAGDGAGAEDPAFRFGLLLPAVWLAFLVFPIAAIWADDDHPAARAGAIVAVLVFAVVYLHGFHRQIRREQEALLRPGVPADDGTGLPPGTWHFAALVALIAVAFALSGVPALGVMSFVVAFAVFHFAWPVVAAVIALGLGAVVLIPVALGVFSDFWFLTLIVATVAVASVFIRIFEDGQLAQAELQTRVAVSGERERVARDVHDVLGHSLTAVILKAELCSRLLDGVEPADERARAQVAACRDHLAELRSIGRSALAEIRSTVGGLRTAELADELAVARTVLADAGVELLVVGDVGDVPERFRPVSAWVVREAVTNVVRHARASRCTVELRPADGRGAVVLRVGDDGIGMEAGLEGNGLRGLRERVTAAGAALRSRSDGGTVIEVVV